MTIAEDLDRAIAPFSEGKPDAPQNARTIRVASILDTVMVFIGDQYTYDNVWDEWPQSCHIVFNVGHRAGDEHTYWLMSVSHRDLHYCTDAALVAQLQAAIPYHLTTASKGPAMKSEDNGCL